MDEPYDITLGELYGVWTTSIENAYQRKATFSFSHHVTEVAICFDPSGNPVSCGISSIGGDGTFDLTGPEIDVTIDPSSVGPLLTERFTVQKYMPPEMVNQIGNTENLNKPVDFFNTDEGETPKEKKARKAANKSPIIHGEQVTNSNIVKKS